MNERRGGGSNGRFVTWTVHLFSPSYLVRALILARMKKAHANNVSTRLMHPLFRRGQLSFTREKTRPLLVLSSSPLPPLLRPLFTLSPSLFPLRVIRATLFVFLALALSRCFGGYASRPGVSRAMTREPVIKRSFNLLLVIHDY